MMALTDERSGVVFGTRHEIASDQAGAAAVATGTELAREPEPEPDLEPEPETAIEATASDATASDAPAPTVDPGLVPALNRVADAFERMAASIDVEHREREARLDAVERLLRELVTGLAQPTAVAPVVLGGSISLDQLHDRTATEGADAPVEIDLADPRFELERSDDAAGDAG
jgi:hypothetical protein